MPACHAHPSSHGEARLVGEIDARTNARRGILDNLLSIVSDMQTIGTMDVEFNSGKPAPCPVPEIPGDADTSSGTLLSTRDVVVIDCEQQKNGTLVSELCSRY